MSIPELGQLALALRSIRDVEGGGATYEELADQTMWSKSQLQRAMSGKTVPSTHLVMTLLPALHVSKSRRVLIYALYNQADAAVATRDKKAKASKEAPKPQYVRDMADLSGALRDAWAHAGQPALRTMSKNVGPWLLPHSSAHRIVRGRALPRDLAQYVAFLRACGIPDGNFGAWFAAWDKVMGRVEPGAHDLDEAEGLYFAWKQVQDTTGVIRLAA
ncbi:helix-turn-helix domain-containing protein [Streptomyces sp. NPDC004230]